MGTKEALHREMRCVWGDTRRAAHVRSADRERSINWTRKAESGSPPFACRCSPPGQWSPHRLRHCSVPLLLPRLSHSCINVVLSKALGQGPLQKMLLYSRSIPFIYGILYAYYTPIRTSHRWDGSQGAQHISNCR